VIRCQDAGQLIPLHVGDDLPADEARRVEEHLEGCALCSAEYESFAAARLVLLDLGAEVPVRGSLWAEVARELETAPDASADLAAPPAAARLTRSWRWMKWTSAAAAALLVMLVIPPLFRPNAGAGAGVVPESNGPMIQATTPEEVQEFLLRTAGMMSPATDPALNPVGTEKLDAASQDLPLTTPAGNRPPRRL
jgi:hypothetical protein